MKEGEGEVAVQQSNRNIFSSIANFFKQWEKQISGLMTAVLTTLLVVVVQAGLRGFFGYNLALTILIFSFPGAMFGVMRFGYTFKEATAGCISGAISAIAALAIFTIISTVNLFFYEVENILLLSALGVWWIITSISRGLYRKYENYFIPFLLFVAIPSVWTIFFCR